MARRRIALLSTALTLLVVTPASAAPLEEVKYTSENNQPLTNLAEVDAELVIETTSHNHNIVTTQIRSQIEEKAEADQTGHALSVVAANELGEVETQVEASGGGIFVTYDAANNPPQSVKNAVGSAVNYLDSQITTSASGPVEIFFSWQSLGSQSLLGYGGPEVLYQGGSLPGNHAYPVGLVNTLLNVDQNGAARPEIVITLNSDLATTGRWYTSSAGNPASSQIDLYSVTLHEILHGMGFSGSVTNGSGSPQLGTPKAIYDDNVLVDGAKLLSKVSPNTHLSTNNLDASIGGGIVHKLYDPYTWQQGSSFSHFDEASYPTGAAGSLMTPVFSNGTIDRTLDAPILGVLAQIGWTPTAATLSANITRATPSKTSVSVNWTFSLSQQGQVPATLTARISKGGSVVTSKNVSPASAGTTLTGLKADTAYRLDLIANGAAGSKTTTKTFTTTANGTTATGIDVRAVPLDGQAARLYQAYFLRLPDQNGLEYWKSVRASRQPIHLISDQFALSTEFTLRYGSVSNDQFVNLVYQNVLGRLPDAKGSAYWRTQFAAGKTRGQVMAGFSDSAEFIAKTGTVAPNTTNEGIASRLFTAAYQTTPTSSQIASWIQRLNAGTAPITLANEVVASPTYQTRPGSLSSGQQLLAVSESAGHIISTGQLP